MRTSARVALRPNNEAPRAVLADRRGTTNFIISNADEDNLTARRVQRLVDRFGITERRARVFADLAFGGGHG